MKNQTGQFVKSLDNIEDHMLIIKRNTQDGISSNLAIYPINCFPTDT